VENGNGLGYDYPGIDFPDGFVNGAARDLSRPGGPENHSYRFQLVVSVSVSRTGFSNRFSEHESMARFRKRF
jgi:hypothetical protein